MLDTVGNSGRYDVVLVFRKLKELAEVSWNWSPYSCIVHYASFCLCMSTWNVANTAKEENFKLIFN